MKKRNFTFADMQKALKVGWGPLGVAVAGCWRAYNAEYFGGRLKPLPIYLTQTSPYGHWIGVTCYAEAVTHIALTVPSIGRVLVADRGTLLHEMVHQFLYESGENPNHNGEPWRREVMRLHQRLTGTEVWAGAPTVAKVNGRHSRRLNRPHPETGVASLTQGAIARWPHSVDIDLGSLSTFSCE
jgi:hypothetical protein